MGKLKKLLVYLQIYSQSYLDSWVMFATPNLDPVI